MLCLGPQRRHRLVPLILNLKIDGVLFRTTNLKFYQSKQDMVFLHGDLVDPKGVFRALPKARRVEILGDQRTLSVEVGNQAQQRNTLAGDCEDFNIMNSGVPAKAKKK